MKKIDYFIITSVFGLYGYYLYRAVQKSKIPNALSPNVAPQTIGTQIFNRGPIPIN